MTITDFNAFKSTFPDEEPKYKEISLSDDSSIRVLQYLPVDGKSSLIQYVVSIAFDEMTGCFSPIRVDIAYSIGLMRAYCGIHFEEDANIVEAYDFLEKNGILDKVVAAIPEDERVYMEKLVNETIEDIVKYNHSFAGMVQMMKSDAEGLDASIKKILEQVRNKEGLEVLDQIRNVVGTD